MGDGRLVEVAVECGVYGLLLTTYWYTVCVVGLLLTGQLKVSVLCAARIAGLSESCLAFWYLVHAVQASTCTVPMVHA